MIDAKYSYLLGVLVFFVGYTGLEINAKCPFEAVKDDGVAYITCPCDYGKGDEVKEGSTRWAFTQVNEGPATGIRYTLQPPKDVVTLQRPLPALKKAIAIEADGPVTIKGNTGNPPMRSVEGVEAPIISDLIMFP